MTHTPSRYAAAPTPEHQGRCHLETRRLEPLLAAWYVVHTKSLAERLVADTLQRKGFLAYLPAATRIVTHARQRHVVARPLFQRYVMVGLDPVELPFSEVRKTHAVEWFVANGEGPVRIPTAAVEALRRAEEAGEFDETIPRKAPPPFKPGDPVEVAEGPFAGFIADVIAAPSEKRVEIMLTMFGRKTRMTAPLANLRRIA